MARDQAAADKGKGIDFTVRTEASAIAPGTQTFRWDAGTALSAATQITAMPGPTAFTLPCRNSLASARASRSTGRMP